MAAVVLAAGSSRRLGRPKQLLPYRGRTLLDATLSDVRGFGFDQIVVAIGGSGVEVRNEVDLHGLTVVDAEHHTDGCSSSIVAALDAVDQSVTGFCLFLGDQPHVPARAVAELRAAAAEGAPMAIVRYRNGRGHPFWFSRDLFPDLGELTGDKAVWKLIESTRLPVTEVEIDLDVPLDVDTEEDYRLLLDLAVDRADGLTAALPAIRRGSGGVL